MAVLVADCPHCQAQKAAFELVSEQQSFRAPHTIHGWFRCPACCEYITTTFWNSRGLALSDVRSDIGKGVSGHTLTGMHPVQKALLAPEYTPENVANIYIEALDSLQRKKWTSAAAMFRATLEAALKTSAPQIDRWKLEKRIDDMASDGIITPALKDWAHALRLDGNDALHGSAPADEQTSRQMQAFLENLLTYLFTMPERVRLSRESRVE